MGATIMKTKFVIRLILILLFATIVHYMTTRQVFEFMLFIQVLIVWNTWKE